MPEILAIVAMAAFVPRGVDARPATPEQVSIRLEIMSGKESDDNRLAAARWFGRHANDRAVLDAVPALSRLILKPGPSDMRQRLVSAVVRIAIVHKNPCPSVLFDVLYDKDLSDHAQFGISQIKNLDDNGIKALIKYATSLDANQRCSGIILLGDCARHSSEALKTISMFRTDPDFVVRNNAHCTLFQITKNLDEFLHYIFRFRSDFLDRPDLKANASESEQNEHAQRNLMQVGYATLMCEWSKERPGDFRDSMVKALAHADPRVRRGAVSYIREMALSAGEPNPLRSNLEQTFEPKMEGLGLILRDLTRDRLPSVANDDPDLAIRKQADIALWKLNVLRR